MNRIRGRLVVPDGVVPAEVIFDDRIREVRRLGEPRPWRPAFEVDGVDRVGPSSEGHMTDRKGHGSVSPGAASPGPGSGAARPGGVDAGARDDRAAGPDLGPLLAPGFIDVHVHGGGGGDAMDGPDGVRTLAMFHARHGTTSILPTTITNPFDRIVAALEGIREVAQEDARAAPRARAAVIGAHVEGPFISPGRLGAQPPHAVAATAERVASILGTEAARLVTLAPEVEGAHAAAERFAAAGVRVSVGHTRATYAQVAAFAADVRAAGGTIGFTHLYNAMGGLEGRTPGVVGAAFAHRDAWGELILDLHHVEAGSALAAWSAKRDRILLVTDAIRAAGLPEGETELGGQSVRVSGGAARLTDGTLAGSVLTLDVAIRNAVAIGVPLADAIHAACGAPAAYLGLGDRGRIEPGMRGDIVLLDDALQVQDAYVGGRSVA